MGASADPSRHLRAGRPAEAAARDQAVPTWFGPEDRPLFGWVHVPGTATARGAVVLCPPLVRERTVSHSTYRLVAEELAARGLLALRFDYDGSGDASGHDEDPGRVEAWLASVAHAARLTRAFGAPALALLGMRMGALLAAAALPSLGDVAALVLWDPCRSGRAFVREQRALHALRIAAARSDGAEVAGYELTAETVSALARLELPELGGLGVPTLVLERPDRPAALRAAGGPGHVEFGEAVGQDRLLDVLALAQEIPGAAVARVADWLSGRMQGPAVSVAGEAREEAVVPGTGAPVTERCVRLGPHGLFGIEATCEPDPDLPPVLMLNAGNEWHAGPNRLWVDLSRRWAPLGFRCVRFDESGLGDSPTRPGGPRHVVRAPEAFEDVAEACAAVAPGDPDEVVLVGLCSGAYQALEHALRAAPRGVLAVNPVLHFRPPELATGRVDRRRRICRPTTAAVRAYRSVPLEGLKRALRGPLWRAVHGLRRRRSRPAWTEELSGRGVRVLLLGGPDELRPVLELVGARGRDRVRIGTGVEVEVVGDLDHDLMVAAHRRAVTERLTEYLTGTWPPVRRAGEPARERLAARP